MSHIGFYPGSFDPVTLGHIDIIGQSARLFDRLVVGVGVHHGKAPLFTGQERVELLESALAPISSANGIEIRVTTFDNLTVDAAKDVGARFIVRGLRDAADFNYEMQMTGMNGAMAPDIETLYFAASPEVRHIASKFVRQIAAMGGNTTAFVPEPVARRIAEKLNPAS
ncbi:MAG: pantetheine-phosphate adenylyltransferase [Methyloligellaceae bacterium]